MKFIIWLFLFLVPITTVYSLFLFVTWGVLWNPGDWLQADRALAAMVVFLWFILSTAVILALGDE